MGMLRHGILYRIFSIGLIVQYYSKMEYGDFWRDIWWWGSLRSKGKSRLRRWTWLFFSPTLNPLFGRRIFKIMKGFLNFKNLESAGFLKASFLELFSQKIKPLISTHQIFSWKSLKTLNDLVKNHEKLYLMKLYWKKNLILLFLLLNRVQSDRV